MGNFRGKGLRRGLRDGSGRRRGFSRGEGSGLGYGEGRKLGPGRGVGPGYVDVNKKKIELEGKSKPNISSKNDLKNRKYIRLYSRSKNHSQRFSARRTSKFKYYIYILFALAGLFYLLYLKRKRYLKKNESGSGRFVHLFVLVFALLIIGFGFGKSPNPMEALIKPFKALAGYYLSFSGKLFYLLIFIFFVGIGNKLICGWACPFGALQELFYSLPFLKKLKKIKLPFFFSNTVRILLFILFIGYLFGWLGNIKGLIIYHGINPFNIFDLYLPQPTVLTAVLLYLIFSLFIYRPFCYFICPFGLFSWLIEKISFYRIQIDQEKCTDCRVCESACPTNALSDILDGKIMKTDCTSCGRCLTACSQNAITYGSILKLKNPRADAKQKNSD
ncbi:MAG: 4Fe-4S binding protein [Myxococcota bacterium]